MNLFLALLAVLALPTKPEIVQGRILVRPRPGLPAEALAVFHANSGARVIRRYPGLDRAELISVPATPGPIEWARRYRASGLVNLAEPDYRVQACAVPDDPDFDQQWALDNSGAAGAVEDADIDAPEAWEIVHSVPGIIVAVVDSGIRFTHEDLAPNLWVNPDEIPGNEVDDDGNGYVDDVHGVNVLTGNGDAVDAAGHGTHLAGIIGAEGNNGKGVSGVAWKVRLMSCRFLDNRGSGTTADAITAIEYARAQGAHVLNCSWGGPDRSELLEESLQRARGQGILVVAGAGNDSANIDVTPFYPACMELDNIVAVAATDSTDTLWSRSSYGPTQVDLLAPGVSVRSTFFTGNNQYWQMTGSSQAAAHVAGASALLRALRPTDSPRQMVELLRLTADHVAGGESWCNSGRLNLHRALAQPLVRLSIIKESDHLQLEIEGAPGMSLVLETTEDLVHWSEVVTNSIPAGGIWPVTSPPAEHAGWFRARWVP